MSSKREQVLDTLQRSLRTLKEYFQDPYVSEIMVNPGGRVFIERAGEMLDMGSENRISDEEITLAIRMLGKSVAQEPVPNTPTALISASFEDLRIAGVLAPTSVGGPSLTIRKHQSPESRPTLEELIDKKMLTAEQGKLLLDLFVDKRKNFIVAGATGSGKTTFVNALLMKIPKHERLITIEDSVELHPNVPNLVALLANAEVGITAQLLVKQTLRMAPSRLILGETRGTETYDLIRAFNSGHDGSLSTVHASSAEDACGALEMLFQMSVPANASLSAEAARGFIARAVHVIVHVKRQFVEDQGKLRTVRSIHQIVALKGVKNGFFELEALA
ncbi:CpaF family protein [Paraburkholderia youngii]|uniref:CpaF family protein n=1 Tax=Paraburkholderia youngii TaxID=2782701 RepID=UPI003D197776